MINLHWVRVKVIQMGLRMKTLEKAKVKPMRTDLNLDSQMQKEIMTH